LDVHGCSPTLVMLFQSRNSRLIWHPEVHSPGFDHTGEGQPEFSEFQLISFRSIDGTFSACYDILDHASL
jgi:hypothetical protein